MNFMNPVMTAEELLRQGEIKTEEGDYIGAVTDYSKAISLNPNYAKAYGNRGLLRANLGDHHGALQDCEQAAACFLDQGSTANYEMVMGYIKKLKQFSNFNY